MNTNDSALQRPRVSHVVTQTLHFYRRHWRALGPLGLMMLPISLLGALSSKFVQPTGGGVGAGTLTSGLAWLAGLMVASTLAWWMCQSLGSALVAAPAFPRAMRRCRDRAGSLCHVGALQFGRAAWVLGKALLALTVTVAGIVGLPLLLRLPVGVGVAEGTLLLAALGSLGLLIPLARLQLEFLVMTQLVITGSTPEAAHREGLEVCRGNLGWLFVGYLLVTLPGLTVGYGSAVWHYMATGSWQLTAAHPAFYLNLLLGCLLLPITATFPAIAAQALRQVTVEEVTVQN